MFRRAITDTRGAVVRDGYRKRIAFLLRVLRRQIHGLHCLPGVAAALDVVDVDAVLVQLVEGMVVVMLYVGFDAVPPFIGSLMTMLVELPLFYGSCYISLVPSYFIP